MLYKDFKETKLSALGLGMMRLPLVNGKDADVDEKAADEMIAYALQNGINYFDTAYGYHEGNSELVAGRILSKYPRDSYYLATKFPGYDVSNMDKVQPIFEEQLKKCRTEYFDFYLIHNVYEKNIDHYLDEEKYGIVPYLLKQKEDGRIHHLGFSAHGSLDIMRRFLEAYGDKMEFGQIQLNYLDWNFQEARKKVELLSEYNIPVWVMEPVRGGRLAKLSEEDENTLKALRPDEKIPAWAFRFLQAVPEVTMILSGMSNMEQLKENIETFKEYKPLNEKEFSTLVGIADKMSAVGTLPCTGCRYCTAHCPQELDIPKLLSLYNEYCFTGGGFIATMIVEAMPDDKKPSSCIGCKSCEAVCPQQLSISEAMADYAKKLGLK